ncbi:uncharacterized protein LOC105442180 [Strongylocentrotus purpuratus]|uniref:PH domain-containing protein n=1 Tax=Strongylocentrotus purpuratus TaxID=7668 RepID=A0A7M7SZ26_STRPU|nr:uncharacterized protein LOC105442180 [Strongylocentrotus purpuratus]
MSGTTGSHMFLHKAGGFLKDKEQLVICKLVPRDIGERPEIQIFTDGSEEPNSIVKVKSFAAVQKDDLVPKIVKAKYDNYICITGSGSGTKPTYLRTDTREQRDEWCIQLQALMSIKTTPNQHAYQQLQPYRMRTKTDAASNRPAASRARRGAPTTAPGSMLGIFQDELVKVVKQRVDPPEHVEETEESQVCCGRHHLETGASHDALCQHTYENIHYVHNKDDWRRQQQTSMQALKKKQELYQDFHLTKMLQEKPDPFEHVYEIPEFPRDPLPESANRLSGCSTSSEESEGGASVMSAPQSLHSCKEPTESSWPPSPTPSDDSEPECSERSPPSSPTCTRELPGGRFSHQKEPEASMCLNEQIYENTTRTDSRTTTPPRPASVRNDANPHVPLRTSSMPSVTAKPVPPKPPKKSPAKKLETQCKKLKGEKLSGTATVRIAKTIIVRYLPMLSLNETRDSILVMDVPCELKDYFRVGDQWLKVNDNMLKNVHFARDCVRMSDKPEIEITIRRIPFGRICDFQWNSDNVEEIGLKLIGNEIERVFQEGLAHRRGSLQSNDIACLNSAGLRCNCVITEVNFDCVHPDASTEQVWEMIKKAGRIVILILHPVDFRTVQRGYDIDENDMYEDVRS